LPFILQGLVRPVCAYTLDGGPFPGDWAIPIEASETVLGLAPLTAPPYRGVVALVVSGMRVCPVLDDDADAEEQAAQAIARQLVQEVRR
jgi:hypothetical protein